VNKQIPVREAVALLRTMTRVLCAVGILALIFTTVNVTRFASSRDVPLPIAILLDPMIATALAGVLYVDARLASWGITPPAWSTTLRWCAGCTAALMNSWASLWPDRQIGWPDRADPAAVLLHLTPALLLIALTETIAAYRRCLTDLTDQTNQPDPTEQPERDPTAPTGSIDQPHTATDHHNNGIPKDRPDHRSATTTTDVHETHETGDTRHTGPRTGDNPPYGRLPAPGSPSDNGGATDTDMWPRALAMNNAAISATGKPVSIWRLRTELHIGPRRAHQIHERLLAHHTDRPPCPP
jgi:hypothetical protein